jgi:hypothetical protein
MHQSHARNSVSCFGCNVSVALKKETGSKGQEGGGGHGTGDGKFIPVAKVYNSPHCCKPAREAFDLFSELSSKLATLQFVKELIPVWYLGLGWAKAYHPWSRNKHSHQQSLWRIL